MIWIDHPFITNKWRIDLCIWRIVTQLATHNAHPAAVEQLPFLAAAPDLLPHTTVFGGLHIPLSVVRPITSIRFILKVIIKWITLHPPPTQLPLFRHNYMFRQLTTITGPSIQYFELKSTEVQGVQCVGYHKFTVMVYSCLY